jgi:virginiamycin A acetyltransferase
LKEVVGGIPAKEIKKRFDKGVITELQQIQWWNWSFDKIQQFLPYIMNGEVDKLDCCF